MEEGPLLESLTRRLADCPPEFLGKLSAEETGRVVPAAVVSDLLVDLGGAPLTVAQAADFPALKSGSRASVEVRLALLAAWLLHDDWFAARARFAPLVGQFLHDLSAGGLKELAKVGPGLFVSDPDRREELARLALRALGLRPKGESAAQAQDRLSSLDSLETARTIEEARKAQERARKVVEEMAKKAAKEAASKPSRE